MKSELQETAHPVHKRVVKRTINEKGEEVLEEDYAPLEDSRQTQMEAIKSSFGGVKTRASTKVNLHFSLKITISSHSKLRSNHSSMITKTGDVLYIIIKDLV